MLLAIQKLFMNTPHSALAATRITLALQSNGAMSARELAQSIGISQATLSRRIRDLGPLIERVGNSVSTQYVQRRTIRGLGSQWPIYRIDEHGRASQWGELRSFYGGFRFVPNGPAPRWLTGEWANGIFSGLPFFLQDIRPQGYLGRAVARDVSSPLDVGTDPRNWRDDELLVYLLTMGSNQPGDLVIGDHALAAALRDSAYPGSHAIPDGERANIYPGFAATAQRGSVIGSSTGGEQPKFLATVRRADGLLQSVIVKFSAAEASPVSQRWVDLLFCEHLAARILARHQISSASTQILDAGGRRFLEVERFDRVAVVGRRGMLTMGAVDDALLEEGSSDTSWTNAARLFQAAGLLDRAQARELCWRWCFGDLIGNTDMHRSNTSLWFNDALQFSLTPSYDMLPMQFAPGAQGDLSERAFLPSPPLPPILDVWREAASAASEFWSQVIAADAISPAFRSIAQNSAEVVSGLNARFS
jgi:hypothetical protein